MALAQFSLDEKIWQQRAKATLAPTFRRLAKADLKPEIRRKESKSLAKRQERIRIAERNLILLDWQLEVLEPEILRLERELEIDWIVGLTRTESERELCDQVLCKEELVGEAFLDDDSIAGLKEKQDVEWEVEERDRQFDFAEDMLSFYKSEYLWENGEWFWGGLISVMLVKEDCSGFAGSTYY